MNNENNFNQIKANQSSCFDLHSKLHGKFVMLIGVDVRCTVKQSSSCSLLLYLTSSEFF